MHNPKLRGVEALQNLVVQLSAVQHSHCHAMTSPQKFRNKRTKMTLVTCPSVRRICEARRQREEQCHRDNRNSFFLSWLFCLISVRKFCIVLNYKNSEVWVKYFLSTILLIFKCITRAMNIIASCARTMCLLLR